MAENLQDKMADQSFWDEVDSLQKILKEEEKEEHDTPLKISEEEKPQDPVKRQVRPRRHSSKGILTVLYCIIAVELTAILMVAGSWYLWMQ